MEANNSLCTGGRARVRAEEACVGVDSGSPV